MKFWKIWAFIMFAIGGLEAFGLLKQHPENLHAITALMTGAIILCICDAVKEIKR